MNPKPSYQRKRSNSRKLPDLPTYYYHTNFCDMLRFVEARYQHVFEEEHIKFLTNFAALPMAAQCFYVRIAGRKGDVFDSEKLSYPEIDTLPLQYTLLRERGFISDVTEAAYPGFLNMLTKPDLVALMTDHMCPSLFKRSFKKPQLIETALGHMPFEDVAIGDRYFVQGRTDALQFLTFLYFGKIKDNMQSFTLRDLGLRAVPDFKADYSARFDSASEAASSYFYARALHDFKTGTDDLAAALIDTAPNWPEPECDMSVIARDKLLQKLGGLSERCSDVKTALSLYEKSDAPLCNERIIRLRWKRNAGDDREWVQSRLVALIENPGSDDEHYFAQDFYERKYNKKRTSLVTDILRSGECLQADEMFRHEPERAAKRYYETQGFETYRTENTVWTMLFGLLFWDELYGDNAKFHNSFERLPSTLKTGSFYSENVSAIETKLTRLSDPAELHIQLLKTVSRNHGAPNGIFQWSGGTLDKVKALITVAPKGLEVILRLMAQDYRSMKDGFPDLMLVKDKSVRFVEVKAEGDVIRRNQLTRIQQLRAAGFEADIARIDWIIDPNQIYVVVDVETTGGRAGLHRVTEIGAVKVQNGKVIDTFQTLLNPERSIPSFITRLTGITHDMVKDAPRFAEIADDFAAFMGAAIFVAHNVNFDYGFIRSELRNAGYSFKHTKLCTCSSMRKHYPGYRSYSLKNLCDKFGIDLSAHHRALCDAQAAAELLFLVNEKRVL